MARTLSLSLRPRSFRGLLGQRKITDAIVKQYASGREPSAWMFTGSAGTGKTTLARILAVSVNCTHQETFGYPCDSCWRSRNDLSILEINASELSGIDDIGLAVDGAAYAPMPPSRRRVFILDEAQRLSKASQNLLLKYFEDCPSTTVWVICTTEPHKILLTLRSRCLSYALVPLRIRTMRALVELVLRKTNSELPVEPLVDALFDEGVTSPRLILMALEKYLSGVAVEQVVLGVSGEVQSRVLCRGVVAGEWSVVKEELQKMEAGDARLTRSAVAGYLRKVMLGSDNGVMAKASESIDLLSRTVFVDESLQLATVQSALFQITEKFRLVKTGKRNV
jgi:DNA polymerase III subunit gamma/tau